jgi:hypothetical protein
VTAVQATVSDRLAALSMSGSEEQSDGASIRRLLVRGSSSTGDRTASTCWISLSNVASLIAVLSKYVDA